MKRICVFCSSNDDVDEIFKKEAAILGKYFAEHGIEGVYGGSNRGLMGAFANGALAHGGKVIAVMHEDILKRAGHANKAKLIITKDIRKRQEKMLALSDAFIALPGGFGTLAELFEVLLWSQLGYHKKPLGFLNTRNHYDLLLAFLTHSVEKKCLTEQDYKRALYSNNIPELMEKLQNY
jgi:uncharacterized protein (TIGR00730 family)